MKKEVEHDYLKSNRKEARDHCFAFPRNAYIALARSLPATEENIDLIFLFLDY